MTQAQLENLIALTYDPTKMNEIRAKLQMELNSYITPFKQAEPLGKLTAWVKKLKNDNENYHEVLKGSWILNGWTYGCDARMIAGLKGEFNTGYEIEGKPESNKGLVDCLKVPDKAVPCETKIDLTVLRRYVKCTRVAVAAYRKESKSHRNHSVEDIELKHGGILILKGGSVSVAVDTKRLIKMIEIVGDPDKIMLTSEVGGIFIESDDGKRKAMVLPLRMKSKEWKDIKPC